MDLLEVLSLLGFAHYLIGNDRKVKYNYISNRVDKVSIPNKHYYSLNASRGGLLSLDQGSRIGGGSFVIVFIYLAR
jgi:hypothetical protein